MIIFIIPFMYIEFITEDTATEEKPYPQPPLSSLVQFFLILCHLHT